MNLTKSKIAERLRQLRLEKNFSQEKLAQELGKTDYTAYQRLESGRTDLKFEDAVTLARFYDVPMEYLLSEEVGTVAKDRDAEYKKRNSVSVSVVLDGSENTLEKQMTMLAEFNKILRYSE